MAIGKAMRRIFAGSAQSAAAACGEVDETIAPNSANTTERIGIGTLPAARTLFTLAAQPLSRVFDGDRQERHDHDRQDNPGEMLLYCRDSAEQIAGRHQQPDPQQRGDDAEGEEAPISHVPEAGYEGCKRSHDRDEARKDDRLSAMAGIEILGAFEGPAVEPPGWRRVRDSLAEDAADPVVAVVAGERGSPERECQQPDAHAGRRPKRAGSEQAGVPRQERR